MYHTLRYNTLSIIKLSSLINYLGFVECAVEHEGVVSIALVPNRNVVAPAPLQPRAPTIGNISMLLPLQVGTQSCYFSYILKKYLKDIYKDYVFLIEVGFKSTITGSKQFCY